MTVGIRAWLRCVVMLGGSNGGLSHMEDVSEQDRGYEPSPPTRGRKDKYPDVISKFEGRIAKLELGVASTKRDVDLLEQHIKEAMGNLRG